MDVKINLPFTTRIKRIDDFRNSVMNYLTRWIDEDEEIHITVTKSL